MKRMVLAVGAVLALLVGGVYRSTRGRRFLKPGGKHPQWYL